MEWWNFLFLTRINVEGSQGGEKCEGGLRRRVKEGRRTEERVREDGGKKDERGNGVGYRRKKK